MDDLRARISFQWDIRDCNILCLSETWLTPSVPDTAVTPSNNFSVLRMDRTAEAGKIKGGGVCFMINKKWCDPRNISILSRSCSPHLEHFSIICRPFYLPREFSAVIATAVYIPPQADTSLALSKLQEELSGYINKHPDAVSIIAGDFNPLKPTGAPALRFACLCLKANRNRNQNGSAIILFAYKIRDVTHSNQANNMLRLRCFHPLMSLHKLHKMRFQQKHCTSLHTCYKDLRLLVTFSYDYYDVITFCAL